MTRTGNTPAVATSPGSPPDLEGLGELLAKATPGNLDSAQVHEAGSYYSCPFCDGQGEVEGSSFLNYDGHAVGVQFFGVGDEFEHNERLYRAVMAALPWLLDRAREAERADRRIAFTEEWYGARWERLTQLTKEKGFWSEAAEIMANGGVSSDAPPTYTAQLMRAKHRAEAAEARLSALTHAAREYQRATQARLNAPAQPDRWDAYAQAERDLIRALEAQ